VKNLTVNINGDVHITAPTPRKSPPSAMVGVVELECDRDTEINFDFFNIDPDYDEDDEDAYDDSNLYVLYAVPGETAVTMRLIEALERMQSHGRCNRVGIVPTHDLLMAYDSDTVYTESGERYLTGPAIVFHAPFDIMLHISADDAHTVSRILEERTVSLKHGDNCVSAYVL
jgi:hypothetical protein